MKLQTASKKFKTPLVLLAVLAVSSGLSCAVAPGGSAKPDPAPVTRVSSSSAAAMETAWAEYSRRNFSAASAGFDALAKDAGSQQLATLGKALIHLSTDPEWRNLNEAGRLLQTAEGMENGSVEVQMLMNALSSLIGVEANNSELRTKVNNSLREIARLNEDKEAMATEQAALNEALEKLKALTIGN